MTPDDDDDTGSEDNYSVIDGHQSSFRIAALNEFPALKRNQAPARIKPHPVHVASMDKFAALDDAPQEYDKDVLAALGSWAHQVHSAPKRHKVPKTSTTSKLDR